MRPSKEERRSITPGKIFDFYFEDFITGVILKAAQAKYEAEKSELKNVTRPPTLEDIRRVILAVLIMIASPQRWTKLY